MDVVMGFLQAGSCRASPSVSQPLCQQSQPAEPEPASKAISHQHQHQRCQARGAQLEVLDFLRQPTPAPVTGARRGIIVIRTLCVCVGCVGCVSHILQSDQRHIYYGK